MTGQLWTKYVLFLVVSALCAATPRSARAQDLFIRFDGLPGESMDIRHPGWSDVLRARVVEPPDQADASVEIQKNTDGTSTEIWESWRTGEEFATVSVDITGPEPSAPQRILDLENVTVTSYELEIGLDGTLPVELFSLSFEASTMRPFESTDLNLDQSINVGDADLLCRQVAVGSQIAQLDINGDGQLDDLDMDAFLRAANHPNGDANFDGSVAFADFLIVVDAFGDSDTTFSRGDFNCDGSTGFVDFLIFNANFGQTAGRTVRGVPEPGGRALVSFAVLTWLASARRRFFHIPRRRTSKSGQRA